MISSGTMTDMMSMMDEHQFTFPVLIGDEQVFRNYQVPGTPFLYLISSERKVQFKTRDSWLTYLHKCTPRLRR